MVFLKLEDGNHEITGYRLCSLDHFFDEEKVNAGNYLFLCPFCKTDEFVSFSESVCECDNCSHKLTFFWH